MQWHTSVSNFKIYKKVVSKWKETYLLRRSARLGKTRKPGKIYELNVQVLAKHEERKENIKMN